jgi:hypothetical protein
MRKVFYSRGPKASRGIVSSLLSVALAAALFCRPAQAQVLYGSIVGNVSDQSQAPAPGAASL